MDDGCGRERLSLLGRRLPSAFQLRADAVAPGCERAYDETDWQDAIVVVERGEIEVECLGGSRRRFERRRPVADRSVVSHRSQPGA